MGVCPRLLMVLIAAGCIGPVCAAAPPGTDVDNAEVNCLASVVYRHSRADVAAQQDVIAWVVRNRKERAGTSYCELAADAAPPGAGLALAELARRQLDNDPEARVALDAYRVELARYQQAQIVAYKVIHGWLDEDPTQGATDFPAPSDGSG